MKLNWKKKWLQDKSGYWYSAKVPLIHWEYIIDCYEVGDLKTRFLPGVFFSRYDEDVTKINHKKEYKTEQAAQKACEKHLKNSCEKFKKWIESEKKIKKKI